VSRSCLEVGPTTTSWVDDVELALADLLVATLEGRSGNSTDRRLAFDGGRDRNTRGAIIRSHRATTGLPRERSQHGSPVRWLGLSGNRNLAGCV
jgi:hypothetical protein